MKFAAILHVVAQNVAENLVRTAGSCALAILLPNSAHASDVSAQSLRLFLKARSLSQFSASIDRRHRLEKSSLVCELQLKSNKLPTACFETMKLRADDDRMRVRDVGHDSAWLNELCISRAQNSRDEKELEKAVEARDMPGKCRQVAESRLGDLRYTAQTTRPHELFVKMLKSSDD